MSVEVSADLTSRLEAACLAMPFYVGWHLTDLVTGSEAARNGDVVVPSGSTRKVAILVAALSLVNQAALALDNPVRIPASHFQNDSGVLRYLTPGLVLPLRDVLTLMIIVSDNACTGAVCDIVTLERVNKLCASLGMMNTAHREPMGGLRNVTTPNDMGKLLVTLARGAADSRVAKVLGLTPALCESALDTLKAQQFRQRMPSRLPDGTIVAHKTGVDVGSFSDAGIVYREELPRFVLAVYTSAVPRELPDGTPGFAAAGSLIGTLTRICWDHLT